MRAWRGIKKACVNR
ncbi:hypothetical protein VCHC41A1_0104, partial [Vibrio cholerae HC-41A1]